MKDDKWDVCDASYADKGHTYVPCDVVIGWHPSADVKSVAFVLRPKGSTSTHIAVQFDDFADVFRRWTELRAEDMARGPQ